LMTHEGRRHQPTCRQNRGFLGQRDCFLSKLQNQPGSTWITW
jgi:hypothetical protein